MEDPDTLIPLTGCTGLIRQRDSARVCCCDCLQRSHSRDKTWLFPCVRVHNDSGVNIFAQSHTRRQCVCDYVRLCAHAADTRWGSLVSIFEILFVVVLYLWAKFSVYSSSAPYPLEMRERRRRLLMRYYAEKGRQETRMQRLDVVVLEVVVCFDTVLLRSYAMSNWLVFVKNLELIALRLYTSASQTLRRRCCQCRSSCRCYRRLH